MNANPFRVYYPHGGGHLLLSWYTDYDRGHLIIARNERAVIAAYRRVLVESPEAVVKAYVAADIVAPPPQVHRAWAARCEQGIFSGFRYWVLGYIDDYQRVHRGALPDGFSACGRFVPEFDDTEEDEHHYGCTTCCRKVIPVVGWEALWRASPARDAYLAYEAERTAQHREASTRSVPRKVVSQATVPTDDEPLWYVRPNHGPHSDGNMLAKVVAWEPDYPPHRQYVGMFSWGALFFFRHRGDLDATEFHRMSEAAREREKREQEKKERTARATARAEQRARAAQIASWVAKK